MHKKLKLKKSIMSIFSKTNSLSYLIKYFISGLIIFFFYASCIYIFKHLNYDNTLNVAISRIFTFIFAYYLHSKFTFNTEKKLNSLFKFFLLRIFIIFFTIFLVNIFQTFQLTFFISCLVSEILVAFFSFYLNKKLIFKS